MSHKLTTLRSSWSFFRDNTSLRKTWKYVHPQTAQCLAIADPTKLYDSEVLTLEPTDKITNVDEAHRFVGLVPFEWCADMHNHIDIVKFQEDAKQNNTEYMKLRDETGFSLGRIPRDETKLMLVMDSGVWNSYYEFYEHTNDLLYMSETIYDWIWDRVHVLKTGSDPESRCLLVDFSVSTGSLVFSTRIGLPLGIFRVQNIYNAPYLMRLLRRYAGLPISISNVFIA